MIVLVLFVAADVALIYLNRSGENLFVFGKRLPDAMAHVPGRLLGEAQIPVQLH